MARVFLPSQAAITAAAKATLGAYPKPYRGVD